MKHQYSEILHAIADGKEIQFRGAIGWREICHTSVLHYMSRAGFDINLYRIKPATSTINGVACAALASTTAPFKIRIILFDGTAAVKEMRFFFDTKEDGDTAYAALLRAILSRKYRSN